MTIVDKQSLESSNNKSEEVSHVSCQKMKDQQSLRVIQLMETPKNHIQHYQ